MSDNFYITMRPGHKNYHKMKMIIEFRKKEKERERKKKYKRNLFYGRIIYNGELW